MKSALKRGLADGQRVLGQTEVQAPCHCYNRVYVKKARASSDILALTLMAGGGSFVSLVTPRLPPPGLPRLCDYKAGSSLQDASVQAVARSVPDTIQQRVHFDLAVYSAVPKRKRVSVSTCFRYPRNPVRISNPSN